MRCPLAPLLDVLRPTLPEQLVPADCFLRIRQLSQGVPPGACWVAFECRLEEDPRVDFAVALAGSREERDAAAAALSKLGSTASVWSVQPLLTEWLRSGSLLHEEVPRLWIEYDLPATSAPRDFVFVSLEPRHPFALSPLGAPGVRATRITEQALALLQGGGQAGQALPILSAILDSLPPGGLLRHVAITPHRGHHDLRIHVTLPLRALSHWLRRISWPGDPRRLEQLLTLCGEDFMYAGVQLSAGSELRPYLGIELCCDASPSQTSAWRDLFARLIREGLGTQERAASVLTFWGRHRTYPEGAPWPITLSSSFYVKLTLRQPDVPIEAKAYLTSCPQYTLL